MNGKVVLVGGGPGDPDLITVRGLDRLLAADVVITDRLAPTSLLDRLGPDVEIIDAARAPGRRTLTYDEIVALMIDRARAGKDVVRLKGGDPFVFAHGAQEVASCTEAGLEVEVVPGVTSATGAAVLAGVPLTSTVGAVGFTVVSGHLDPDDPTNRLDWTALARAGTTIVVLMGMKNLAAIAERLQRDGVPADVRCTCVADASLPTQREVRATLADIARDVAASDLRNPAVILIESGAGPVPALGRVLVLGGSRSGKSGFAESLLTGRPDVGYVATAADRPGDPEWDERISKHRQRRPASWRTIETGDLAGALREARGPLLVDSVTTWLARAMDETGVWAADALTDDFDKRVDAVVTAWQQATSVVVVSDEVGSGVVPDTRSGRLFRDALGELNQRLAAAADEVHLVTAGIARRLVWSIVTALGLFTVVPVPARELTSSDARGALRWLPLVGAGLGAVAALPLVATSQWAPHAAPVAAVVAVGLLAALTRGLHLDGLADTVDGLGSRAPAERALTIMRQSDIGPFGVVALVIVVLLDAAALAVLPHGVWTGCAALAVAAATGRLAVVHASSAAPARPDGFGALVQGATKAGTALTVAVLAGGGLLALAVGAAWWWWVLVQAVALLAAYGLRRHTSRRFGGTTGDVYGALVETATAITLVGLCLR